jgi:hypothetical protein
VISFVKTSAYCFICWSYIVSVVSFQKLLSVGYKQQLAGYVASRGEGGGEILCAYYSYECSTDHSHKIKTFDTEFSTKTCRSLWHNSGSDESFNSVWVDL